MTLFTLLWLFFLLLLPKSPDLLPDAVLWRRGQHGLEVGRANVPKLADPVERDDDAAAATFLNRAETKKPFFVGVLSVTRLGDFSKFLTSFLNKK